MGDSASVPTVSTGPVVHDVGDAKGRVLFGVMTPEAFTTAKSKKSGEARATLKLAGAFVTYAPSAKVPTLDDKGQPKVHASMTLDADEAAATLRAWGVASFVGAPQIAALLDAAKSAAQGGRAFVLRLPATGADSTNAAAILATAAAYDPTAA